MATIKKILSAIVAIVLVVMVTVVTFGFKASPNATMKPVTKQWFTYNLSTPVGQNINTNYDEVPDFGEPANCRGNGMICAVLAEPITVAGVVRPDLSTVDDADTKEQAAP